MLSRRTFSAGLALLGGSLVLPRARPARALVWQEFAWEPVERAHAEAIPIVVAFHSKTCAVCRTQEALLDEVLSEPSYVRFVRFRADFDVQKDAVDQLKVKEPGTVIAYVCNEEIGRMGGDLDPAALRKLLEKTQIA